MRLWHVFHQTQIGIYCGILMLLMIGDGVMSYFLPIMIENTVNNQLTMGIILGSSSFVGFICDFVYSKWFKKTKYSTIAYWAVLFAIALPGVLIVFGSSLFAILLAMAIWGMYYELVRFSNYHFVDEQIQLEHQPWVWGVMSSVWSLAWFIAPILATLVAFYWEKGPLFLALLFYCATFLAFIATHQKRARVGTIKPVNTHLNSYGQEVKIWWVLLKKIWPVYLLELGLVLVMSGFWSVGALLANDLGKESPLGILFFAMWTAPPLFFGLLTGTMTKHFRKKRTSFATAFLSGMVLIPFLWIHSIPWIIVLTFVSSALYSISYPSLDASIQEYVKKLGVMGNDLMGLQS